MAKTKEPKNGAAAPEAATTGEQPAAAAPQDGADQAQAGPEQPTAGTDGEADQDDTAAEDAADEAALAAAKAQDEARAADQAAADAAAAAAPETATLVPMDAGVEASPLAKSLLLEASERWGIVPTMECEPRELLGWRFVREDRALRIPAHVVVKTAGGLKLRHYTDPDYIDQDTDETLARIFGAYAKDPKTKEVIRLPLPEDQALPPAARTGFATSQEHSYRRGYLKGGGKKEADRREAAATAKRKK